ncbi:MAG TPA: V-type ATP synthase subunit I [Cyclobacteriaceae bacterium]
MKTEFRKLILLTHDQRRKSLTAAMQELGLLHITHEAMDSSEETESLIHERNRIDRIIRFVENETEPVQDTHKVPSNGDEQDLVDSLMELEEKIESKRQQIEKLKKQEDNITPWGDYSYRKFEPLIQQGLNIFLCRADKKQFEELDRSRDVIELINYSGSEYYFTVITKQESYDSSFESFPLPKISLSDIRKEVQELKEILKKYKAELQSYVPYIIHLKDYRAKIADSIALAETETRYEEHFEGKLISITAWFPVYQEKAIIRFLKKEKVAWQIRKPKSGEDVPVLLENTKYPSLFEPITRIFELPNYYETDPTPFLAVFYPILFAYCLGDAGYGFVLMIAALVGYFTFLKNSQKMAFLGMILGVVTMVMGLIKSGSLFGVMLLPDHPVGWIRKLSEWVIIPDDSSVVFNAFNVSLMIGVIQIITGSILKIYNKIKYESYQHAIAPFGKLLIVISLIWIFLADMQEIQELSILGVLREYLLIIGVLMVVFFHELDSPILHRIGKAFMPLFFIFTGILGDVLSYVRLFALGLASSVLGLVVNQIGMQIIEGSAVGIVIGIVFLLFGHTLNFGIAALGSFVHPLRLTFVEFYGNIGFQGKGIAYRPFSKSNKILNY